ncbi:MAG TPA: DNA-binding response regulator [Cytophagales bacterium]|nr:DNA-binding response regulator [Cytophagales bacterium]HAA20131.1 DNA-binding response regulator [Cytophagales bacterium]HAP59961.1 DNA-binding response regulator [Cytophagales bacterium]
MNIRCVITDDEPIALQGMQSYVEKVPYLECVGTYSSALDLLADLDGIKPDLLLLDIEMPHLTGIELLQSLSQPPLVIFTTAYDQYAIQGFELEVVDYLLKPIAFPRFLQAMEKVKKRLAVPEEDWFFVKTDQRTLKLRFADILYVEGMQNYAVLHTPSGQHIAHLTLKSMLEQLPKGKFLQPHKSYLVNIAAVEAVEGNQLVIGATKIPIGRTNREVIFEQLIQARLLKR